MTFAEYTKKIKALGRAINPEMAINTRDIISPLLDTAPFSGVNLQRDISYGNDTRHRLDIFTAAGDSDSKAKPLLIFIHGGGFVAGDKYTPNTPFYDNVGVWALKHGLNALTMTYRLAPEHQWPSAIDDIHQLMQFVKKQGADYGLGSDKIFLMGQSAGAAHASAYLAHPEIYKPDVHGLRGVILLSGLYNFAAMPTPGMHTAYLGEDESLYAERSSLNGLVDCDVPMLLTLSQHDPGLFEAQTLELLGALQKRHQSMPRFAYLTGQNHISAIQYLGLEGDLLAPQLLSFIEEHS